MDIVMFVTHCGLLQTNSQLFIVEKMHTTSLISCSIKCRVFNDSIANLSFQFERVLKRKPKLKDEPKEIKGRKFNSRKQNLRERFTVGTCSCVSGNKQHSSSVKFNNSRVCLFNTGGREQNQIDKQGISKKTKEKSSRQTTPGEKQERVTMNAKKRGREQNQIDKQGISKKTKEKSSRQTTPGEKQERVTMNAKKRGREQNQIDKQGISKKTKEKSSRQTTPGEKQERVTMNAKKHNTKRTLYGSDCTRKCNGRDLICRKGKCTCKQGHSYNKKKKKCRKVNKKKQGRRCTKTEPCRGKFKICFNGRCQCKPGYYPVEGSKFCKKEKTSNKIHRGHRVNKQTHGKSCKTDTQCKGNYRTCFDGTCMCIPGYFHVQGTSRCKRDCNQFVDTMTVYPRMRLTGREHIDPIRLRKSMPFKQALKWCLAECVEIDYGEMTCKFALLEFASKVQCNFFWGLKHRGRTYTREKSNRYTFFTRKCRGTQHHGRDNDDTIYLEPQTGGGVNYPDGWGGGGNWGYV